MVVCAIPLDKTALVCNRESQDASLQRVRMDDSREDRLAIATDSDPLQELFVIGQYLVQLFLLSTVLPHACTTCSSLDAVVDPLAHFLYLARF